MVLLLSAVSLLSALHLGYLTRQVGKSRSIHGITPPAVNGAPEFERTFRAHQNCVEFYPIFLVVFWTAGLHTSEVLAAVLGLFYIYAQHCFFFGYQASSKGRLSGFYASLVIIITLANLATVGIFSGILDEYFDIDLKKKILK
ncbi:microsomal glutathione S-transferase 2 [Erpetoichthys calabaricus]|uniref:Microsomal glutathione S-transferase 2 n=1 Tax=Erpetoichthys calabaricus TaxID=27687 RepID=A0A8C4RI02_ERPCA|nr:microsomal glutathione S-transferase 2 [Erpetoichthys calabaricus]